MRWRPKCLSVRRDPQSGTNLSQARRSSCSHHKTWHNKRAFNNSINQLTAKNKVPQKIQLYELKLPFVSALCIVVSKINVTPKVVYLSISKLYSTLAVANLLAHNNISQIYYCGQISVQIAAVNCSSSDKLTPLGVTYILLAMVSNLFHIIGLFLGIHRIMSGVRYHKLKLVLVTDMQFLFVVLLTLVTGSSFPCCSIGRLLEGTR